MANLNEQSRQGLERAAWFQSVASAYAQEHATRPATIGLVLSSSPIALLAWYFSLYIGLSNIVDVF